MQHSCGLAFACMLSSLRCQELMLHLNAGIWQQLRGSAQQLNGY